MLSSEQAGSISPVKKETRRRHASPGGGLAKAPPNHKNMQLKRFFQNPFLSPRISLTELQAFSEDHLGKLSAANGAGQFDAMRTKTRRNDKCGFVALRLRVEPVFHPGAVRGRWTSLSKPV